MKHIALFFVTLFSGSLFSQSVGIGTISPDPSAILDLSSTSQGFLLPRMSTSQRDAIMSPTQGLKIFNTDDRCEDTYDGQKWAKICDMKQNGDATLSADNWRQKADLVGLSRVWAVGFVINNKLYFGTGSGGGNRKDFWEFDPFTNIWTQKADFGGTARYGAVGFSIDGKGYIGTGLDGSYKKDFWEYDPILDIWTQKADFGGDARYFAVGFSINGKGYLGTGYNSSYKKDFWEFDPVANNGVGTWTQKEDFGGVGRHQAVGFALGGKGYIGTGNDGSHKKDFWEFTPAGGGLGTWVAKTDFGGSERSYAIGFSINGKGYLGTGFNGSYQKDFWEFDPAVNSGLGTWTIREDYGGGERNSAVGLTANGKGYVMTGSDGMSTTKDIWEYNTLPVIGKEYVENMPNDAIIYRGYHWTYEVNKLYATFENVDVGIGTHTPKVKLHVEGNNDAGLGDNSGMLLVGEIDGSNIIIDNNEIMARDNGVASQLILQNSGGNTSIGGNIRVEGKLGIDTDAAVQLHITNGGDVGYNTTTTGFLQMGATNSTNIIMDNNEIMARDNGQTSDLILQNDGGSTYHGGDLEVGGNVSGAVKLLDNVAIVPSTHSGIYTLTVGNKSFIRINNQQDLSSNLLLTVALTNGEAIGHILTLLSHPSSVDPMLFSDNTSNNLVIAGDFTLSGNKTLTLIWNGSNWAEVARGNN